MRWYGIAGAFYDAEMLRESTRRQRVSHDETSLSSPTFSPHGT
jgi:hypothetical protein